jgi:hypothetical protein
MALYIWLWPFCRCDVSPVGNVCSPLGDWKGFVPHLAALPLPRVNEFALHHAINGISVRSPPGWLPPTGSHGIDVWLLVLLRRLCCCCIDGAFGRHLVAKAS